MRVPPARRVESLPAVYEPCAGSPGRVDRWKSDRGRQDPLPQELLEPHQRPAHRNIWYRANGPLPDDAKLHRYLLAYASDFYILRTAMEPHGVGPFSPGMQVASLDHAMWFYRPFRMDEWLLYAIESPSACGARGLVRGHFFSRDGTLVASIVQEGLMRDRSGELEGR